MIDRYMWINLPSCKVLAEKRERPHKPLIDLIECQLILRWLENCLQRQRHNNMVFAATVCNIAASTCYLQWLAFTTEITKHFILSWNERVNIWNVIAILQASQHTVYWPLQAYRVPLETSSDKNLNLLWTTKRFHAII